jgi:hypothetical protein
MPWNRPDDDVSPLDRWRTIVDQAIVDAQERGEFDDLPGAGKPLQLEENPFAGDAALGFRVLKNAGMAPPWIEADREMSAASRELDELLARTRQDLARFLEHQPATPVATDIPSAPARWPGRFRWRSSARTPTASRSDRRELERVRQQWRHAYLDQAARLDQSIGRYNLLLPASLRWLERPRLTAERAGNAFDTACPPGDG